MSESKGARGDGRELEPNPDNVYNIHKLSRELLIRVFSLLPFHQRHETIPLVCRKWAQLTSVPCEFSFMTFVISFVASLSSRCSQVSCQTERMSESDLASSVCRSVMGASLHRYLHAAILTIPVILSVRFMQLLNALIFIVLRAQPVSSHPLKVLPLMQIHSCMSMTTPPAQAQLSVMTGWLCTGPTCCSGLVYVRHGFVLWRSGTSAKISQINMTVLQVCVVCLSKEAHHTGPFF